MPDFCNLLAVYLCNNCFVCFVALLTFMDFLFLLLFIPSFCAFIEEKYYIEIPSLRQLDPLISGLFAYTFEFCCWETWLNVWILVIAEINFFFFKYTFWDNTEETCQKLARFKTKRCGDLWWAVFSFIFLIFSFHTDKNDFC